RSRVIPFPIPRGWMVKLCSCNQLYIELYLLGHLQPQVLFQPVSKTWELLNLTNSQQYARGKGITDVGILTDGQRLPLRTENDFLVCDHAAGTHSMHWNAID